MKWGYKIIARCGLSDFVYDFHIDGDAYTTADDSIGATGDIVLHLCSTLPDNRRFFVYMDRFYTSLPLIKRLEQRNIFTVGTIMSNRLRGCPLKADNELRRGEYDEISETNANRPIAVVKWMDSKAVVLCSNFVASTPVGTATRFSRQLQQRVEYPCPAIVKEYSRHMGGVDLFDMLKGLYTIDRRGAKFYFRIVHYLLSICCINGWLLYRRHQIQRGESASDLLKFTGAIATTMTKTGSTVPRRCGRPRHDVEEDMPPLRRRRNFPPQRDIRMDGQDHWPQSDIKGRCAKCHYGNSRWKCTKCKVRLCLNSNNNCFFSYHMQ